MCKSFWNTIPFGLAVLFMVLGSKCNSETLFCSAIGAMAGVKVPIVSMKHGYVVTERIEGIRNMPNVRDHDLTLYVKLQGDTLQVGGFEPNPIFVDDVPNDFAFSLYEFDWDVFSIFVNGALHRIPIIESTGIRSTVCGPESFTPDHKPLLGESPEVRGFYLGCGMNSLGMSLSGCGEQLAKWIIKGRPDYDMFSYDIRRFTQKLTDNKQWIHERSHEVFAKNYSMKHFHDEALAGRNQRCDVLYEEMLNAGCVYQERHGWERPGWFDTASNKKTCPPLPYDYYGYYGNKEHDCYDYRSKLELEYTFDFPKHHHIIGNECLTCRDKAAVFNLTSFGKFYLSGPDAQIAADLIFTNNMRKTAGSVVYTCMLNNRGGTELDLTVSVMNSGNGAPYAPEFEGTGFYLAVGSGVAQHAYSHIHNILQDRKLNCTLSDCTEDMSILSVQGPHSKDLLQSLTSTSLNNAEFPLFTHKIISIAGHECRALRLSFVGELGWELHVPNISAVEVYQAIMQAGEPYGVVNAGFRALDSLSAEKGYRHWHADLRSDDTPLESGLGFTCKLNSDVVFIGKDALMLQKKDGIRKRLVCFTMEKPVALQGIETIRRNKEVVGLIRRADFAFSINKSIAYGYVTRPDGHVITTDYLKDGVYTIEHIGNVYPADLHLRSPFDPQSKRLHGNYAE